jgi:hypothetical protein
MRINSVCAGMYYTVLEITECGAASVTSTIVQDLPVLIVHSWCARLTALPLSCADYLKIWDPNFQEPSGSVQACTGISVNVVYKQWLHSVVHHINFSCWSLVMAVICWNMHIIMHFMCSNWIIIIIIIRYFVYYSYELHASKYENIIMTTILPVVV